MHIVKDIVVGDKDCESAEADLRAAVAEFSSTLANLGFNVVFQTLDVVEGNIIYYVFLQIHSYFW